MRFLEESKAAGRRIVLLVDGTESNGISAKQRKMMADFTDDNWDLIAEICIAQSLVLESAIQRGVLTAMLWIKKPPTLLKSFATRGEAVAWLDTIQGAEDEAATA